MIDRKAIAAGIAEMKAYLVDADEKSVISFLGKHVSGGVETVPDEIELEGSLNLVALSNAFMSGAGIHPLKDVSELQAEVREMRRELRELAQYVRASQNTMGMLGQTRQPPDKPFNPPELSPARQALRDNFKALSGAPDPVTPPLGGPITKKD